MVLKSVGVMSVAKVMGTLCALMGLIFGAIMALVAMSSAAMSLPEGGEAPLPAAFFGVGAVIILPIMYGICGFIGGIIMAALYNLVAGLVGGLEFNFESGSQGGPYA